VCSAALPPACLSLHNSAVPHPAESHQQRFGSWFFPATWFGSTPSIL
jgi:hypothetical protein